jgi:hypothetical protein
MIMLSFSTIVINRNFGLFISAYSFIGLIIFSDYHQIADFAYYRMDDQVIMDFDERALRKSKPFYILPYYLIIIGFVYLMYFYGIMGDVDLILFITLSIATIPFFLKGPRRAKANIKKKMYYTYDDISIPMQVVEPVKYKMVIFVMLGAMYLLLFLTPKVDYIVNLIIIAIVSLHSYLFSEFDIVLLYYFNEEGQIVKEY